MAFLCHGASWTLGIVWATQTDLLFGHYHGHWGLPCSAGALALVALSFAVASIRQAPASRGKVLLTILLLAVFSLPSILLLGCLLLLAGGGM